MPSQVIYPSLFPSWCDKIWVFRITSYTSAQVPIRLGFLGNPNIHTFPSYEGVHIDQMYVPHALLAEALISSPTKMHCHPW